MLLERHGWRILQESRVTNAQLIEQAFYQKKDEEQTVVTKEVQLPMNADCLPEQTDALSDLEVVNRFLNNPDLIQLMREMLKASGKGKYAYEKTNTLIGGTSCSISFKKQDAYLAAIWPAWQQYLGL